MAHQQTLIQFAETVKVFHAGTNTENTGASNSISVRFTPSQQVALEKLANDRNESRAEYIRKFFEEFIDFEPHRKKLKNDSCRSIILAVLENFK